MPPEPRLKVTVNEKALHDLCEELAIPVPKVQIISFGVAPEWAKMRHGIVAGDYQRLENRIRVFLDLNGKLETERLIAVNTDLVTTLLHEIMHAVQQATWTEDEWKADQALPYRLQRAEREANDFAYRERGRRRGLISIKRTVSSRFSKLSAAQAKARTA